METASSTPLSNAELRCKSILPSTQNKRSTQNKPKQTNSHDGLHRRKDGEAIVGGRAGAAEALLQRLYLRIGGNHKKQSERQQVEDFPGGGGTAVSSSSFSPSLSGQSSSSFAQGGISSSDDDDSSSTPRLGIRHLEVQSVEEVREELPVAGSGDGGGTGSGGGGGNSSRLTALVQAEAKAEAKAQEALAWAEQEAKKAAVAASSTSVVSHFSLLTEEGSHPSPAQAPTTAAAAKEEGGGGDDDDDGDDSRQRVFFASSAATTPATDSTGNSSYGRGGGRGGEGLVGGATLRGRSPTVRSASLGAGGIKGAVAAAGKTQGDTEPAAATTVRKRSVLDDLLAGASTRSSSLRRTVFTNTHALTTH
jgi:hypothetical protein